MRHHLGSARALALVPAALTRAALIVIALPCAMVASARHPANAPPVTARWADVEGLAADCFVLVHGDDGEPVASVDEVKLSPESSRLPGHVRTALTMGCLSAASRVAFQIPSWEPAARAAATKDGLDAGTVALRQEVLADPRASRLLRKSIAQQFRQVDIRCADCEPAAKTPRPVAFLDFVPYLVRLCYVSSDDVPSKVGRRAHFHLCSSTNDLATLVPMDSDLASVSYSALASVMMSSQSRQLEALVGSRATDASADTHGKVTRADLDAINARLQRILAKDDAYLSALRPAVATEARMADLDCTDCGGR